MTLETLTFGTIKTLLIRVFENITGLAQGRVIFDTSGGVRPPEGLYCSLWIKDYELLPENEGDYSQEEVTSLVGDKEELMQQTLRHESLITVRIELWGHGAFETGMLAMQKLQSGERFFDLWQIIGSAGVEPLQDVSMPFNGSIREQCYFDFSFYATIGQQYPLAWFDVTQWKLTTNANNDDFTFKKEDKDVEEDCSCLRR